VNPYAQVLMCLIPLFVLVTGFAILWFRGPQELAAWARFVARALWGRGLRK
jgi:hypothetical protein